MRLDASILVPVVRSALEKGNGARFVAIQSEPPPAEPFAFEVDGAPWEAVPVRSTLQARRAMLRAGDAGRRVLLTAILEDELGEEVVARLAQRRVHRVEPWQLVRAAFQAQSLDPRVTREPWMAEALITHMPAGGYPKAASGTLDLEQAWQALSHAVGLPQEWSAASAFDACVSGGLAGRWATLEERFRAGLRARFGERLGAVGEVLGALLERGKGDQAVALGLVAASIVRAPEGNADRIAVQVRMGDRFGVSSGFRAWGDAAERWCEQTAEAGEEDELARVLEAAGREAEALGAARLLGLSPVLPQGVEQRCRVLAEGVQRAVEALHEASRRVTVEAAARDLNAHLLVQRKSFHSGVAERVEDAVRLVRWLAVKPAQRASLADHAAAYRDAGAWVDRARHGLSRGLANAELQAALALLGGVVRDRREEESRAFAERLAVVTAGGEGDGGVLYLEQLYREVVAPLAKAAPVLVVVMDGMSQAVFQQLAQDVEARTSLSRIAPEDEPTWRPVIAPLPTVTEVCRASLLCGELTVGPASVERAGLLALAEEFRWNRGERGQPFVFHKGTMHEGGGGLAPEVRAAIEGEHRVVTVVVNAVDDQLPKASQIELRWTLDQVPELKALIACAEAEQRAIVLTADHGHVVETWDGEGDGRHGEEKGERWRAIGRALSEMEVEVRGRRVLLPDSPGSANAVVLPWSERLRYSARHAGYHGGASPQEVVVPLGVFAPQRLAEELTGWRAEIVERPRWWAHALEANAAEETSWFRPEPPRPTARRRRAPEPSLFPPPGERTSPPSVEASWVDALLASEIYRAQKRAAQRQRPDDAVVAAFLRTLDDGGGSATLEGLRNRLGLLPIRFTGVLSLMQKLLNVDGFAVLEVNRSEGRVTLDRDQLRRQFRLGERS